MNIYACTVYEAQSIQNSRKFDTLLALFT